MGEWEYGFGRDASAWNSETEIELHPNDAHVSITQGGGYMQQHCSARIPTAVLVELLTRAGYTVTRTE